MKKGTYWIVGIILAAGLSYAIFFDRRDTAIAPAPVPLRQEGPEAEVTYDNASEDVIKVDLPYPGAVTGKEFSVIGQAKGWAFEGSFPVLVLDKDGKILAQSYAQTEGDWMSADWLPFKSDIKIPDTYIGPATLVLKNDNPSDMRQYDQSISFPITIEY